MAAVPVSVVIPAFNAERFLAAAIESVQAQTLNVAEIIVVDNGSIDRTAEIAADLGVVIVEERERGVSRARNTGISQCRQEWIALLDADDLWDPEKIQRQWAAIQACPNAGLVACYFRVVQDGAVVMEITDELSEQRWAGYDGRVVQERCSYFPKLEHDFFPRFQPSCSDAVVRHDVFATVGLFDETVVYNEDFEFFMRVFARYPLAIVEETLVSCRRHDQKRSLNLQGVRDSLFAIVNHMLEHPEKYPAGAPQVYRDRLKQNFLAVERALRDEREARQGS
jgi:glycosyltransferase involved in cell wall biosynthesis